MIAEAYRPVNLSVNVTKTAGCVKYMAAVPTERLIKILPMGECILPEPPRFVVILRLTKSASWANISGIFFFEKGADCV